MSKDARCIGLALLIALLLVGAAATVPTLVFERVF